MNTIAGAQRERGKRHPAVARSLATADLVRITAHHVSAEGRCEECGAIVTAAKPLCPRAAAALRELARRDGTADTTSKTIRFSVATLLRSASAHRPTPEGRCFRCGFVYTPECQDCPPLRRIRRELEARGIIPLTTPEPGVGTCAGKSASWELTGQNLTSWQRAIDSCHECPILTQCGTTLRDRIAGGEPPQDQIVAGAAFDYYGNHVPADRLRAYAVLRARTPRGPATHVAAGGDAA